MEFDPSKLKIEVEVDEWSGALPCLRVRLFYDYAEISSSQCSIPSQECSTYA